MISLVYFSTATIVPSRAELDALVAIAARNNAAAEVTGLLCHHDGSFLQFLEGDEARVAETFERIERDPRHRDVLVVDRRPIVQPAFGAWSMALVHAEAGSPAQAAVRQELGLVTIDPTSPDHAVLAGFLGTFRRWLR